MRRLLGCFVATPENSAPKTLRFSLRAFRGAERSRGSVDPANRTGRIDHADLGHIWTPHYRLRVGDGRKLRAVTATGIRPAIAIAAKILNLERHVSLLHFALMIS